MVPRPLVHASVHPQIQLQAGPEEILGNWAIASAGYFRLHLMKGWSIAISGSTCIWPSRKGNISKSLRLPFFAQQGREADTCMWQQWHALERPLDPGGQTGASKGMSESLASLLSACSGCQAGGYRCHNEECFSGSLRLK